VNTSLYSCLRLVIVAATFVPVASGCVCWEAWCAPSGPEHLGHAHLEYGYGGGGHHVVGWNGPSMCFGYYPTCWRPWPLECPPCPPFALEPAGAEIIKPPHLPGPAVAPGVAPTPDSILVPPLDQETEPPLAPPDGLPPGTTPPPALPDNVPEGGASSRRHWNSDIFVSQQGDTGSSLRR
jgi:hypothetical protein